MNKSLMTLGRLRLGIAAVLVLGLTYTGTKYQLDWGTLCTYCPVGMLEVMLAAKTLFLPKYMLLVIPVIAVALVCGRWFCAWGCPTTLTRGVFNQKKNGINGTNGNGNATKNGNGQAATCANEKSLSRLMPYTVFGGALLASFVVGFPVFCLICPIGLFFGFLFALWKVSTIYQPGWELVVFPVILFLELFVLRSWCSRICPLGMVFKLTGAVGRTLGIALRPMVKTDLCLSHQGHNCNVCSRVCPEHLEVRTNDPEQLDECTLCLECYSKCVKDSVVIRPELTRKSLEATPEQTTQFKN